MTQTSVYVEVGDKRVFASAADWPGWSRSGKTEEAALEALAAYAPRYAPVAKLASVPFSEDATNFKVVERQKGSVSTDFGVPGTPAKNESKPMTPAETKRMVSLLEGAWTHLENVRKKVPEELRKGPRGGGRDREKMYAHVVEAELGYARMIGLRLKEPDRKAMVAALCKPNKDNKWPAAYAVRRIAWHALDHAWEMEDRIP